MAKLIWLQPVILAFLFCFATARNQSYPVLDYSESAQMDAAFRPSPKLVFQIVDRPRQFSQGARLNGIFAVLKVAYRTLRYAGLAEQELGRKLLGSCPDFIQVFRIHHSFVFPKRLIHW